MHREDDPGFWQQIYDAGPPGWDAGGPVAPLARLARDRAIVPPAQQVAFPGSGPGHDAVDWARAGHHVMGFDFAPAAVQAATERARAAGVAERCRFVRADLFDLGEVYPGVFDVVVEYTCMCALHPERRGAYREVIERILRPGGLLVGLWFPASDPGEDGPPYLVRREDVERLFLRGRGAFELVHEEVPPDSIERRRGRERVMVLRKPQR